MKPILTFASAEFLTGSLGEAASVPDILEGKNIQNKTIFELDEDDEIYEGYGKLSVAFPYRQYTCYTRSLHPSTLKTAILENDYLCATFLPELGGRLWSLIDKRTGRNLLYTNDVIRPGNLAIRNAWFSGGVEWNIGLIGHTPFTMEPLFTATLEDADQNPVLRMYEYERIRKVTYQMDFWLEEDRPILNCRMRICNQSDQVIPMYWWSNIAVPEHPDGRIIVPASEAYTSGLDYVCKKQIPFVDGVDITQYTNIPDQVDYFFHILPDTPKYIANFDATGYGLLHLSTSRLQSRKLFSWGKNDGSNHWQEFLTEHAGRYIEIQGGLGKTQYGCIPMAPNTAWEWLEQYSPIQMEKTIVSMPFDDAVRQVNTVVLQKMQEENPELKLKETKTLAKTKGTLIYSASGYGALENALRASCQMPALSPHLDFGSIQEPQQEWYDFLTTGLLPVPPVTKAPSDFMAEDLFHKLLVQTIESSPNLNAGNWYAHYQLGLSYLWKHHVSTARKYFLSSLALAENPWSLHALAVLALKKGNKKEASGYILRGLFLRTNDLSYLKEGFKILLLSESYTELLTIYEKLPNDWKNESRIYFDFIVALSHTGKEQVAYDLLMKDSHYELADIRECDDSIGDLWTFLHKRLYGTEEPVPHRYNFNSIL